jgi:hypothetical protein
MIMKFYGILLCPYDTWIMFSYYGLILYAIVEYSLTGYIIL